MGAVGDKLDEQGRALLAEDLRSPCTEEVAVFQPRLPNGRGGRGRVRGSRSAPTGHTILLLDAAEAYHREVLRQSSNMPELFKNLLYRLRDPGFTRILLVTLPEATPCTRPRGSRRCRPVEIHPLASVINQALTAVETTDPVLSSRQLNERVYIEEVVEKHSERVALVPWLTTPPVGSEGLRATLGEARFSPSTA